VPRGQRSRASTQTPCQDEQLVRRRGTGEVAKAAERDRVLEEPLDLAAGERPPRGRDHVERLHRAPGEAHPLAVPAFEALFGDGSLERGHIGVAG